MLDNHLPMLVYTTSVDTTKGMSNMGSKPHADCHRLTVGQGKVAFHFEGKTSANRVVERCSTMDTLSDMPSKWKATLPWPTASRWQSA